MLPEEKEIKLNLISEENYRALLLHFNRFSETWVHKNYFFDTRDKVLLAHKWALRIRLIDNKALLTAKGPGIRKNEGLLVRPEIESEISKEEAAQAVSSGIKADMLPQEIGDVLDKYIKNSLLRTILTFETSRTVASLEIPDGLIRLEIDRTAFSDGSVDYEMEIELGSNITYDRAMASINELFALLQIPCSVQKQDKFVRALKKMGYNTPING